MAIETMQSGGVNIHLWIPKTEIEGPALQQIERTSRLPWAAHVAVMPDCHAGKGATVGTVVALRGAVCPAAVGVDIGCGMMAVKTNLNARKVQKRLPRLRSFIEEVIPVGFRSHQGTSHLEMPAIKDKVEALFDEYPSLDFWVRSDKLRAMEQCGSLGGGNHFIELSLDTERNVWMMLHSGSRYIGKQLADVHIARAKELAHNADLPDSALSVFLAGTPEMEAYRKDLYWCQRYAHLNREVMFELYRRALLHFWSGLECEELIECHHNYMAEETHFGENLFVIRKGAIRAAQGEMGIIPGSMGTKSYIVRGLGNAESLNSAPHGAGRKMSRSQAKKKFTLADLKAQTNGVECRKDRKVIDECPGAYKKIEKTLFYSRDLVEIVAELKQILSVKG